MKQTIIVFIFLLTSITIQAKVKNYTFGGFDLGITHIDDKDGEPSAWGSLLGVNLGHEIRFNGGFNFNVAVGGKTFQMTKNLGTRDIDIYSNVLNLRINPTYEIYDFLDVGLQLDLMKPGLRLSEVSREHQIYSVNMYYNIPDEHSKFRIGFSLGSTFDDSRHTQGMFSLEYSFGHQREEKMRQARGVRKVYKTPGVVRNRLERHIHFQHRSAKIGEADKQFLERLAKKINEEFFGIRKIEIRGYSPKSGQRELNYALSELRAVEVGRKLISEGVHRDMIKVIPMGDTQSSFQGIEYNAEIDRRVIIVIIGEDAHKLEGME